MISECCSGSGGEHRVPGSMHRFSFRGKQGSSGTERESRAGGRTHRDRCYCNSHPDDCVGSLSFKSTSFLPLIFPFLSYFHLLCLLPQFIFQFLLLFPELPSSAPFCTASYSTRNTQGFLPWQCSTAFCGHCFSTSFTKNDAFCWC